MNTDNTDKLGRLTKGQLAQLIVTTRQCQQSTEQDCISGLDPETLTVLREECLAIESQALDLFRTKFIEPRDAFNDVAVENAILAELPEDWEPDYKILGSLTDVEARLHTEQPLIKLERRLESDDVLFVNAL